MLYTSISFALFFLGELIGVDYLLRQMGRPPQTVDPDAAETVQLLEDVNDEGEEDEGFDDPTVSLFLDDPPAFPSPSTAEDAPIQIPAVRQYMHYKYNTL